MTNIYYYHLDDESKARYSEKLEYNGITLPDPLDTELRLKLYKSLQPKNSPNITFGDIYMFLVEEEKTYSREDFKSYKNLDCFKMVCNSKVRDILAYKSENPKMCVLTCDIETEETAAKLFRTWVVCSTDGIVQNGHCTCMKGLEKVCCHVAALLLAVENTLKKEQFNKDNQTFCEEEEFQSNQKIFNLSDYFETNRKKYVPVKIPDDYNMVNKAFKKHFQAIKKIVPNAPIFDLLPEEYSLSEVEIIDIDDDNHN